MWPLFPWKVCEKRYKESKMEPRHWNNPWQSLQNIPSPCQRRISLRLPLKWRAFASDPLCYQWERLKGNMTMYRHEIGFELEDFRVMEVNVPSPFSILTWNVNTASFGPNSVSPILGVFEWCLIGDVKDDSNAWWVVPMLQWVIWWSKMF